MIAHVDDAFGIFDGSGAGYDKKSGTKKSFFCITVKTVFVAKGHERQQMWQIHPFEIGMGGVMLQTTKESTRTALFSELYSSGSDWGK